MHGEAPLGGGRIVQLSRHRVRERAELGLGGGGRRVDQPGYAAANATPNLRQSIMAYALLWRLRSFADVFFMPSTMSWMFCSESRGCIGMLNSRL